MTDQPYFASALCWDRTRLQLYKAACLDPDQLGNSWAYNRWKFDCSGYLPYDFYTNLYNSGEIHQCVCKFANTESGRVFVGHWGNCNGACVSDGGFNCQGMLPIPINDKDSDVDRKASADSGDDAASTNVAVPLSMSWKAMLAVAMVVLVNGLA